MKRNGAIVLAGGSGTRFGNEKKQFFKFHGKMLYEMVLEKVTELLPREDIVVVGVDVPAGETRSRSVVHGLKALSFDTNRVVILEAARPLITVEQIRNILDCENPSCSFVMPCVNTPIFRDGTYLDRNKLYDLLVPQSFDYKMILKAYETGKYYDFTDDTRVIFEEYGIRPLLIETGENLYKVTYKRDIAVLESIFELMNEGKI